MREFRRSPIELLAEFFLGKGGREVEALRGEGVVLEEASAVEEMERGVLVEIGEEAEGEAYPSRGEVAFDR